MGQYEIFEFVNKPENVGLWFTVSDLKGELNLTCSSLSHNINRLQGVAGVVVNPRFPVKDHHCFQFAIKGVLEVKK